MSASPRPCLRSGRASSTRAPGESPSVQLRLRPRDTACSALRANKHLWRRRQPPPSPRVSDHQIRRHVRTARAGCAASRPGPPLGRPPGQSDGRTSPGAPASQQRAAVCGSRVAARPRVSSRAAASGSRSRDGPRPTPRSGPPQSRRPGSILDSGSR